MKMNRWLSRLAFVAACVVLLQSTAARAESSPSPDGNGALERL